MVLFGGFHGFDDSGGESVVLQFIDPFDCDSARSGNLVDFYAGVGVIVLNQCGCSFKDCAIICMASLGRSPISIPACMAA